MGYSKFTKKDNSSMITYVGQIVTAVLDEIDNDLKDLDTLMRLQNSAMRVSYNDITKRGYGRKESTSITAERFLNNKRYMRDAFVLAEQTISSQNELLPLYVEENTLKLNKIQKKKEKLEKNKKAKFKEERLSSYTKKMGELEKRILSYEEHIRNGTHPPVVFGTKKNFKALKAGNITKEQWVESRRNSLYSVGEKSKGGNENIKLIHKHDDYFELSILNPLAMKRGTRLKFITKFPRKMTEKIIPYLKTGEAYTIRVTKDSGVYSVHITMSAQTLFKDNIVEFGAAGIDINPDNISVSFVDKNGNYRGSKIFKFPEINYVRSNKRDYIVGNVVKDVVRYIKGKGVKLIVIEDLKFRKSYVDSSSSNRLLSNFVHSKIVNIIGSRCYKEDIVLKKVNPAYTSLIGRIKYQKRFGISVHEAAAICIARKGIGYSEKLPKSILEEFFAMEVEGSIKISDKKNKEYWRELYEFLNNRDFKKNIYRLDKMHLEVLGIKRNPREWFLEDYIKYFDTYILGIISQNLKLMFI